MISNLILFLINIYLYIIIADAVLSFLPQFRYRPWAVWINRYAEYSLKPIRKLLPPGMGIDPSPAIVMILIMVFKALW